MNTITTKKRNIIIPVIFIAIVAPLLYSYILYHNLKVSNEHANMFEQVIMNAVNQRITFDMKDATPFVWDRFYVFGPYAPKEEMERLIGLKWTTNSYLGFIITGNSFLGDYPLNDDAVNKIVFVNDDKVILDVTLLRSEIDFTNIEGPVDRDEAKFKVKENTVLLK